MSVKDFNTYLRMPCLYVIVSALLILGVSCSEAKNITYFNGLTDTTINANTPVPESPIQSNDLLSISVSSLNPEATNIYNSPNVIEGTRTSQATGYLVNGDGTIQFPVLGNIKAAGLTKDQLQEKITQSLVEKKLLIDPIVSIRFLNFRVTVLGEVGKPAVITVPSEKISLLEALGMAGDLTIYGKRNTVLVIREQGGQKIMKRLNLNSSELLTSPYYYLKSNDIVYVEPNSAKVSSSNNSRMWLPLIFSGLSMVAVFLDLIISN